jgi:hypothetical protein
MKRLELRRRTLKQFSGDVDRYLGVALIVLALSISTPLLPISLPSLGTAAVLLIIVGIVLLLTIIFLPVGLFLL